MLSCFLLKKKKKALSLLQVFFVVVVGQQLASLAEWLDSSCISNRAWVLNLVSAFFDFFSYLRGMLEPRLDHTVHATGSTLNQAVQRVQGVHRITNDARFLRLKKPDFHPLPS